MSGDFAMNFVDYVTMCVISRRQDSLFSDLAADDRRQKKAKGNPYVNHR
jgi:hypothetical protein